MKKETDVLVMIERVSVERLRSWVDEDLVRPTRTGEEPHFNDADIARIRLIDTLIHDMEVGEEAVPIILSLIDQIHDMRLRMRCVADAIDAQPDDVKSTLRKLLNGDG